MLMLFSADEDTLRFTDVCSTRLAPLTDLHFESTRVLTTLSISRQIEKYLKNI